MRRQRGRPDGDGPVLLKVGGEVAVVLVGVVAEQEDYLDVVAAEFERLKGGNGLRDAAQLGVSDEDRWEAERSVQVGLRGPRGAW